MDANCRNNNCLEIILCSHDNTTLTVDSRQQSIGYFPVQWLRYVMGPGVGFPDFLESCKV